MILFSQREWLAVFLGAFLAIAGALGMGHRGASAVDPEGQQMKDGGQAGTNGGGCVDPDGKPICTGH